MRKPRDVMDSRFEYSVECLPETTEIDGNASAINPEIDKKIADNIKAELESGNQWAWCTVKVTATYKNLEYSEYLGCCSYKSEQDFLYDGYYLDMLEEVTNALLAEVDLQEVT